MPTNDEHKPADYAPPSGDTVDYPTPSADSAKAGYEMTDVNAGGIVVFLGGLFGFVLIFFVFCFVMGRLINDELLKQDGATDQWHKQNNIFAGALNNKNHEREDLKSNAAIEQQQLKQMTDAFPGPRLQMDDGNNDTYELHAREDLLLDYYSTVPGEPTRIPIERAMELIAAKGLPVSTAAPAETLAKDEAPEVKAPLTTGFARTGYELTQIEARQQRLDYGEAKAKETSANRIPSPAGQVAELKPVKQ